MVSDLNEVHPAAVFSLNICQEVAEDRPAGRAFELGHAACPWGDVRRLVPPQRRTPVVGDRGLRVGCGGRRVPRQTQRPVANRTDGRRRRPRRRQRRRRSPPSQCRLHRRVQTVPVRLRRSSGFISVGAAPWHARPVRYAGRGGACRWHVQGRQVRADEWESSWTFFDDRLTRRSTSTAMRRASSELADPVTTDAAAVDAWNKRMTALFSKSEVVIVIVVSHQRPTTSTINTSQRSYRTEVPYLYSIGLPRNTKFFVVIPYEVFICFTQVKLPWKTFSVIILRGKKDMKTQWRPIVFNSNSTEYKSGTCFPQDRLL